MVTSFTMISSSFAHLPEHLLCSCSRTAVFGFCVHGTSYITAWLPLQLDGVGAGTYAHVCKYIHTPHILTQILTSAVSHFIALFKPNPQQTTHTLLCTRKHTQVYPPALPLLLHFTHKQPGICHGGWGVGACGHTRTSTHTNTNTSTHKNTVPLPAASVPFWPFDRYTEDLKVRGEALEQVYKSETCPLHR